MVLSVIFKKKFPNCGAFDRNCGVFWEKNSGRVLALFGPEKGAFWFKTFSHFAIEFCKLGCNFPSEWIEKQWQKLVKKKLRRRYLDGQAHIQEWDTKRDTWPILTSSSRSIVVRIGLDLRRVVGLIDDGLWTTTHGNIFFGT